jgi:hypothetical protein
MSNSMGDQGRRFNRTLAERFESQSRSQGDPEHDLATKPRFSEPADGGCPVFCVGGFWLVG